MIFMFVMAGLSIGVVTWFALMAVIFAVTLGCADIDPKEYAIGCCIFAVTGAAGGYLYFFFSAYPLVQAVIGG